MFELTNNNRHDLFDPFDDFFNDSLFTNLRTPSFKMDVKEDEKGYVIEADMPGINKEDIALDYNNDTLYVAVKHEENKEEKDEKNAKYLHRERRMTSMKRGIYLKDINAEAIDAKLENGVLKITAPKLAEAAPKYRIEIK